MSYVQQPYSFPPPMSYSPQQTMATYNPAMSAQQTNYVPPQTSQFPIPQQVGTGPIQQTPAAQQWPIDQHQDLPFQSQQVPTPVAESNATDENQSASVKHVEDTDTTSSS